MPSRHPRDVELREPVGLVPDMVDRFDSDGKGEAPALVPISKRVWP